MDHLIREVEQLKFSQVSELLQARMLAEGRRDSAGSRHDGRQEDRDRDDELEDAPKLHGRPPANHSARCTYSKQTTNGPACFASLPATLSRANELGNQQPKSPSSGQSGSPSLSPTPAVTDVLSNLVPRRPRSGRFNPTHRTR
eukprot:5489537-Prymnesium_polylepis.1